MDKLLTVHDDPYEAAKDSHAVVALTEWDEFKTLDYDKIYQGIRHVNRLDTVKEGNGPHTDAHDASTKLVFSQDDATCLLEFYCQSRVLHVMQRRSSDHRTEYTLPRR
ncbi:hypothetical protein PsorP6_006338 [Peronosclerospora sorghi]|uniref:Uncharacterized protein n=1 Tax=Peronosclerospora sorghi TaxID=230839 RepID=A0ACC0W381_9STRA|nr:hypothetical protein PsorP6_006338 [Peronosclerospora sorghi]